MKNTISYRSRREILQKGSLSLGAASGALLIRPLLTSSDATTAHAATIPNFIGVWNMTVTLQPSLFPLFATLPSQATLIHAQLTMFSDGNLAVVSDIDELPPFRGPMAMGSWQMSGDSQLMYQAQRRVLSMAGLAAGVLDVQGTATPDAAGTSMSGSCNVTFTLLTIPLPLKLSYSLQGSRYTFPPA